jgi:hypothetical protein
MGHGVPNRAMVMAMMRFLLGMMNQNKPPGKKQYPLTHLGTTDAS